LTRIDAGKAAYSLHPLPGGFHLVAAANTAVFNDIGLGKNCPEFEAPGVASVKTEDGRPVGGHPEHER
jgi:hypothetical protein